MIERRIPRPHNGVAAVGAMLAVVLAWPAVGQAPAGRMVEVDGQSFHVMTAGFEHLERGVPVVVLESGAGTPLGNWGSVFTDVAGFAPVVAYDRSGIGRSPWDGERPIPERRLEQLRGLLAEVGASPPYVLVGHSWGGPLVRFFAGQHPDDVAGVVYVDPTDFSQSSSEQRALFEEVAPGGGEAEWEATRQAYIEMQRSFSKQAPPGIRAEMDVVIDFMELEVEERGVGPWPEVPVAVLLGAKYQPPPPGVTLPVDMQAFHAAQLRQRIRKMSGWALEAPDGLFVVARYAGHYVHNDDPGLVVHAVRAVVFPDVSRQLRSALAEGGDDALIETYGALKRSYPSERFHENLLNGLGYELLRSGRVDSAIAVFELNVDEYPDAWNPHDSLGDGYRAAGRIEEAIASYRTSLELNPEGPSRGKLEALEGGR